MIKKRTKFLKLKHDLKKKNKSYLFCSGSKTSNKAEAGSPFQFLLILSIS